MPISCFPVSGRIVEFAKDFSQIEMPSRTNWERQLVRYIDAIGKMGQECHPLSFGPFPLEISFDEKTNLLCCIIEPFRIVCKTHDTCPNAILSWSPFWLESDSPFSPICRNKPFAWFIRPLKFQLQSPNHLSHLSNNLRYPWPLSMHFFPKRFRNNSNETNFKIKEKKQHFVSLRFPDNFHWKTTIEW